MSCRTSGPVRMTAFTLMEPWEGHKRGVAHVHTGCCVECRLQEGERYRH